MADGELGAVFRALAKDAAEAAEKAAKSIAKVTEQTADIEERNVAAILDADAKAADRITAAGKKGTSEAAGSGTRPVPAGPPWPVADGVDGAARGKTLNPPNARHTVSGARHGIVRANNSVVLRGNEDAMRDDVAQIAAGNARWDKDASRYEINGRTYGVEPGGTVYPDSGPGIAKLDRNEYAALSEIAKAGGDPANVPAFTYDPRFVTNPDAIAKAKAIYDGTYQG